MAKVKEGVVIILNENPGLLDSSSHPLFPPQSSDKARILLTWKDINYTVNSKEKSMHILKGVSGYASPGEILAIMGKRPLKPNNSSTRNRTEWDC